MKTKAVISYFFLSNILSLISLFVPLVIISTVLLSLLLINKFSFDKVKKFFKKITGPFSRSHGSANNGSDDDKDKKKKKKKKNGKKQWISDWADDVYEENNK